MARHGEEDEHEQHDDESVHEADSFLTVKVLELLLHRRAFAFLGRPRWT